MIQLTQLQKQLIEELPVLGQRPTLADLCTKHPEFGADVMHSAMADLRKRGLATRRRAKRGGARIWVLELTQSGLGARAQVLLEARRIG